MDPYAQSQPPIPPNLPTGDFAPPTSPTPPPTPAPTPVPAQSVPQAPSIRPIQSGPRTSVAATDAAMRLNQMPPAPVTRSVPPTAPPPPPPPQRREASPAPQAPAPAPVPPQVAMRPPTYQPLTSVPGYTPPVRAAYVASGDLQLEATPPGLPVPKQVSMKTAVTAIVGSLALVVVGGGAYLYFTVLRTSPNLQESLYIPPAPRVQDSASLGGEIYDNVANPVGATLPEGESPVENPLEGTYENPFQ